MNIEMKKYILNSAQKNRAWYGLEMWGIWDEQDPEWYKDFWWNKEWFIINDEDDIDFPYSLFINDFRYDHITKGFYEALLELEE